MTFIPHTLPILVHYVVTSLHLVDHLARVRLPTLFWFVTLLHLLMARFVFSLIEVQLARVLNFLI